VLPAALDRARLLADGPRQTMALIKRGLARALELDLEQTLQLEAHLQTLAGKTGEAREAIRAFIEKRPPIFGKHP
jgi:2-(1,2-epoxy-1,2-dihydrophenyl)acetyl-CoA isomerase